MFGKLFASMFEGSLYGHWQAIVTLQQMVILADLNGTLDMTPHALAARTSIPLEVIQEGIRLLEEPDEYSRSAAEEGRRIVRLDDNRPWGWHVVNYKYYRDLATAEQKRRLDRERIATKRDAERHNATSGDMSPKIENVAYAEAEAEEEAEAKTLRSSSSGDLSPSPPGGLSGGKDVLKKREEKRRAVAALVAAVAEEKRA